MRMVFRILPCGMAIHAPLLVSIRVVNNIEGIGGDLQSHACGVWMLFGSCLFS